jgi:enoyl-CoA hydratase/carnithine racemase
MTLLVQREAVWTVTLDRPARANALSADLVEDLHGVLDEAVAARPGALVLRGNDRHFSAGFDLTGLGEETDATLAHRFLRVGLLLERLLAAPFPTIGVAEGAAVGAGADLLVHCDHRLVAPSVRLRFPGREFGVRLGAGRRDELGTSLVSGRPDELRKVLAWAVPARPAHDADRALADLARSVAVPGLHARLTAYAATTRTRTRTKEPA